MAHYVYMIKAERYVKIGHSMNVQSRLANMQTSSPRELQLVATRAFETKRDAEGFERNMHDLLAEHRQRGEWFHVCCVRSLSPEGWEFAPPFNRLPATHTAFDLLYGM